MTHARFALYYLPPAGELASFGAGWLGWDVLTGREAVQPDLDGIDAITATPRRYGFHATLKPPFRLAEHATRDALEEAIVGLAGRVAAASCAGLSLSRLGRFLALTPAGDADGIARVAAACVDGLDGFRAQPPEAELDRRRGRGLSPRQEALLMRWGYPYVMEEFRFHMTLTGSLPAGSLDGWTDALSQRLPDLPRPFVLDEIALVGERADGRFELLRRFGLTG